MNIASAKFITRVLLPMKHLYSLVAFLTLSLGGTLLITSCESFLDFKTGDEPEPGEGFSEILSEDWAWQFPYPQGNSLKDVHVISATTVFAVGENGTVLHSRDGGESWYTSIHAGHIETHLNGIFFPDQTYGWITGDGGVILFTENSGESWQVQETGTEYHLLDLYFLNNQAGWAAGENGVILHTTDRGDNWSQQETPEIGTIAGIQFIDPQTGWAAGDALMQTDDGGESWEVIYDEPFRSFHFLDEKTGWATASAGNIYKTEDGGQTWQESYISDQTMQVYNKIYFADDQTGWAAGFAEEQFRTGIILKTTDGGATWIEHETENHVLSSIHFADSDYGWSVGKEGILHHSSNGGDSWQVQSNYVELKPMSVGRWIFNSVHFIDENHGWAGGGMQLYPYQCRLMYTENGGLTWQDRTPSFCEPEELIIHDLYFVNPDYGWIAGQNQFAYTTDGGESWSSNPDIQKGRSVDFTDTETGWIVGSDGLILHSADGGVTWEEQNSDVTVTLNSVDFINAETGWAGGAAGTILKTTDGGANWNTLTSGVEFVIHDLQFINARKGWAVGERVLFTDDGGATWRDQGPSGNSVWFVDEYNGMITDGTTLRYTNDGGQNWNERQSGSPFHLNDVHFPDIETGWVVGDHTILHYSVE